MHSLIPIPSTSGTKNIEVLIDPDRLTNVFGLIGPIRVVKTSISTSCDSWDLELINNGVPSRIFSYTHDDENNYSAPFDIAEIIGHGLRIMPWQMLQLRYHGEGAGSAICYLEDNSNV